MQLWLLLTCGLVGVFAVPYLVGACRIYAARQRRRAELRQVLKTVREYEFIPVQVESLAETTRRQFERHTPAMQQLGFLPQGDFRMKPQPVEVHNRFFLSPDGDVLGSISALLDKGGVTFISVLADGVCINTTSAKNPRPDRTLEETDQLLLTYAGNDNALELYNLHQANLDAVVQGRGAEALCFSADQLRDLMVYDQRLFNRWRYRHGDFATEPPAADFTTLQQSPVNSARGEGESGVGGSVESGCCCS
ncbi:MAG TPA: hypothetical protein VGI40_03780 [Pirellulaceae bacterium]|jgi:hypothetical protein